MDRRRMGLKVEVESVNGGEDVFDAVSADAKVQPEHLVIIVNGIVGSVGVLVVVEYGGVKMCDVSRNKIGGGDGAGNITSGVGSRRRCIVTAHHSVLRLK
ncbi:hypothetical protein LOK49_LG13G01623 [Camellia lanceoleosa]|uniref:Uncharacterized protein n=1 Tax=Camellia lanceoleosa TaxID=1840588 RepID=A0ACC0FMN6_9ERIC|nr:hypothetical protein LOK49_LG13G01623 [Camellia lanceoleosa]